MGHAFQTVGDAIYLFGGLSIENGWNAELFRFHPALRLWTRLDAMMTGASMKLFSDPGFGSGGGKLYAAGTLDGSGSLRVMELDIDALRWKALPSEASFGIRNWPSIVFSEGSVFVFAGVLENVQCDNALFELGAGGASWSIYTGAIKGIEPEIRSFGGLASLDNLYLAGGILGLTSQSFDLLQYEPAMMQWSSVNTQGFAPSPRSKFGFTACNGHLYVFGGDTISGPSNDLYRINTSGYVWENLSNTTLGRTPPARKDHGMACVLGMLFIFGGKTDVDLYSGVLGDYYVLDTLSASMTWVAPDREFAGDVPTARYAHGITSTSDKVYLFGGLTVNGASNQVFEYDPVKNFWINITSSLSGDTISPRMWAGVAASGDSIYVFGGISDSANGLNDFYRIQVFSRIISDLGGFVRGSPPSNRFAHASVIHKNKFWIFGGIIYTNHGGNSANNDRFRFISLPNDFIWPKNGSAWGFLNIYDWDQIVLEPNSVSIMTQTIKLCTSIFPCRLSLRSTGETMYRHDGYFLCFSSQGCAGISIFSVQMVCAKPQQLSSLFEVHGAKLEISNSTFSQCRCSTDGSVIRANSGSSVIVRDSKFSQLLTTGYGGAIASIGSKLHVFNTTFVDCQSLAGAGAIWAAPIICYDSFESDGSVLEIILSNFTNCSSNGRGGAMMVTSEYTDSLTNTQHLHIGVHDSNFKDCHSAGDGGCIATRGSSVTLVVNRSVFSGSFSKTYGGGISIAGGSTQILMSSFVRIDSVQGGGAIRIGSASFMSTLKPVGTALKIANCTFSGCMTADSGGALEAGDADGGENAGLNITLESVVFNECQGSSGGAVALIGPLIASSFSYCYFGNNLARYQGGAVFIENAGTAVMLSCVFVENSALGSGGGALCAKSANLVISNCSCASNTAPHGGGGALLWDGNIVSPTEVSSPAQLRCVSGNNATFGPCVASNFYVLSASLISPESRLYAGLPFKVIVLKKDVYGQVISTDSRSLIQALVAVGSRSSLAGMVVTSLEKGSAVFELHVSPKYRSVDYSVQITDLDEMPSIYFRGIDTEDTSITMQSELISLSISTNEGVCPLGYVFVVDQGFQGSCLLCEPGTYSVNPLAGISLNRASCLPCPPKAQCQGGASVLFSSGSWVQAGSCYKLIACPPAYELIDSIDGIFNQGVQQCLPCAAGEYNLNPNSSNFTCQTWSSITYILVVAILPMPANDFSGAQQLRFALAMSRAARVSIQAVWIDNVQDLRRIYSSSSSVVSKIAASNSSEATEIGGRISTKSLNTQLEAVGLPASSLTTVSISIPAPDGMPLPMTIGASVAALVLFIALSSGLYFLALKLYKQSTLKALVLTFQHSNAGDIAPANSLPSVLRRDYVPGCVLGKGAFGYVIQARSRKFIADVAIKLVLPRKLKFEEDEIRQLSREANVLSMFTSCRCENAVQLAGFNTVCIKPHLSWFIMEFLDGVSLDKAVNAGLLSDLECIKVARCTLAALKVVHAEGIVHRDIKPANIIQCRSLAAGKQENMYKLIDFGTALGVDEDIAQSSMMTLDSRREMGAGTQPYMSPEMFNDARNAKYQTDLWSLGVTMFQVVTGELPFKAESDLGWSLVIASNMDEPAPNVLDRMEEGRRSVFDHNLARVIATALEKRMSKRYGTVDEMHEAVYSCLVDKGEAFYSLFISYRVASEYPLARLLFDELNHSVTPGGHRVTVYWDAFRLVKGEDWEEGFATGLLNSLCFLPLMSYGSTAPLASGPAATGKGTRWEDEPLGLKRLQGTSADREDNVLKEFLIAKVLLDRSGFDEGRLPDELGIMQVAYPVLVGNQYPQDFPGYPGMGDYFQVQGGGGSFVNQPSPATSQAVVKFLGKKAGLPPDALQETEKCTVASVIGGLTKLQGCQLWKHPSDLEEVELTREQQELVGTGYTGPPVNPKGHRLTAEQKAKCSGGFDVRQLKLLKAQVRAKRADFHETIDRAVSAHELATMHPHGGDEDESAGGVRPLRGLQAHSVGGGDSRSLRASGLDKRSGVISSRASSRGSGHGRSPSRASSPINVGSGRRGAGSAVALPGWVPAVPPQEAAAAMSRNASAGSGVSQVM